jgi:hypothetical protein
MTVCLPALSLARTWNVPAEAPTIQAGIDSASSGDTVLVACDTYYEYDITLKSGVYLTSETGEFDCVTIDAQQLGRVFYGNGLSDTTTIKGFTITGGQSTEEGGGIYIYQSSPNILNCHITGNRLTEWNEDGAGMYLYNQCHPVITGCVFSGNLCTVPSNGYGGAVSMYSYNDPVFTSCTFYGNRAPMGCQIRANVNCLPQFDNCIFAHGIGGAAFRCGTSTPTLTCSDVYGNQGGDWVDCLAGMGTLNNNLSADPGFCDSASGDFYLAADSPCLFGPCGQIGAFGMGCLGEWPVILNAHDVGNDQGHWLRLTWGRSEYDAPGDTVEITGYEVYRRQDAHLSEGFGAAEQTLGSPGDGGAPMLAGWDYIGTVPAHGESLYQYVAPTLCDSTDGGICWSVFFIRAATPGPFVYFDSPSDSGYSVDNLAPAPPPNLMLTSPTELAWDEVEDEDFDYYCVYGSSQPDLDETATVIGYTIGIGMDIAGHVYDYYHVTATDFAGNEGGASNVENTYAGIADTEGLPTVFALRQNHPNPFEVKTSIRFDLPEPGLVRLTVYDVSGRLISTLTDQRWAAGRHSVVWSGDDDQGSPVGPGIYFIRMEAGDFSDTKKMMVLH